MRQAIAFLLFFALDDVDVARLAAPLLRADDEYERAAFVVRGDDGALRLIEWPFRREFRRARWEGAAPEGTIAIVHTHPRELPRPSMGDHAEARRIGLPIYVLTRGGVSVAHPQTGVRRQAPAVVADR